MGSASQPDPVMYDEDTGTFARRSQLGDGPGIKAVYLRIPDPHAEAISMLIAEVRLMRADIAMLMAREVK